MKKNRSTLKDYFKKGAIPTEGNFADLIDSMLTQDEDNISKPTTNDPLKIMAVGTEEALLNFYRTENNQENLAWQVKQKPDGNKPGLNINDAGGSRLFIESGTGNIGVGTTTPNGYKLNVTGNALFTGNYLYVSSETAGRLRVGAAWNIPGLYSGDDGAKDLILAVPANQKVYLGNGTEDAYIEGTTGNAYLKGNLGVGTNAPAGRLTISEANGTVNSPNSGSLVLDHENSGGASSIVFRSKVNRGSDYGYIQFQDTATIGGTGEAAVLSIGIQNDAEDHIALMPSGNVGIGTLTPKAKLQIVGGQIQLDGGQKLAFTDADTTNNLKLQLWTGYGLGINGGTLFYAADGRHSWRDASGTNERMALTTGADGGLTITGKLQVKGSQNIIKVAAYTLTIKNAGKDTPAKWSVDCSSYAFTEIHTAFVTLQGYSLWDNTGKTDFSNWGHVTSTDAIPQHVFVRITSSDTKQVSGTCYCSEAAAGGETDNSVLFTVIVMGKI